MISYYLSMVKYVDLLTSGEGNIFQVNDLLDQDLFLDMSIETFGRYAGPNGVFNFLQY